MLATEQWSSTDTEYTLDDEYLQGMRHAGRDDWSSALGCFDSVMSRHDQFHPYFPIYNSAQGLARVMTGTSCGLNQCRQSVQDNPKRADLYENLARACLKLKQRKKTIDAISMGLRVQPNHPGLNLIKQQIGCRRRPSLPFLNRDHPINRFLGRKTYRRKL